MDVPGSRTSEVASDARVALPKVGVVAAWFDPETPGAWSGLPRGVINEFERLGVYTGFRNVTPWPPAGRIVHRWLTKTKRAGNWILSPEMRVYARFTDAANRFATPRDVDAWLHLVGGYGRVVRGRYATLFEMSPSQLVDAAVTWRESLGYPAVTRRDMGWVARRQVGVYRHAFACCVASRWVADSLVRDHGIDAQRVHVVGYGRNVDVPPPLERDWSSPRFLFVGNDWKRKNGDAVIRAFGRVRKEVPSARLDVVSDHPPLGVKGVVEHGQLAKRGGFAAFDPEARTDLEQLFARATCLVMPSQFEPWGLVYVEAAACGMASIAGSIGGTADSVGAGGIIVDPHDDDAIYRAMRDLCDPDTARELGAVAHVRSASLTWAATAQRVLASLDLGPIPGCDPAPLP